MNDPSQAQRAETRAPAGRSLQIVMFAYETMLDRRIIQEAESLSARGHEVRIATPAGLWRAGPGERVMASGGIGASAPKINTESPNAAEDGDTPPPRSVPHKIMRAVLHGAQRLGLDLSPLKTVARRLAGPVSYYHLPLFAEAIRTLQADIYFGHDLPMLPVALAAAARHGGRVVYDAHELWPEQTMPKADSQYWSRVERRAIRRADAVFTVNPSIAGEMARRYGVPVPHVLRNCDRHRPPAETGFLQTRLGLPPDTKLALFQGRLEAASRLETVIEAWRLLADLPLHLAIVGNGSLVDSLQTLVSRLDLTDRVHFHPHVPQADLPRVTAGAALGLIPYQPDCLNTYYCTPNKLFEYIAAEVPVVATDLPEIRRIVDAYGIGAVGPTVTPEDMAALVRRFVQDTAVQEGLRGRLATAAAALDWDQEARGFVTVVEALEAGARHRQARG